MSERNEKRSDPTVIALKELALAGHHHCSGVLHPGWVKAYVAAVDALDDADPGWRRRTRRWTGRKEP